MTFSPIKSVFQDIKTLQSYFLIAIGFFTPLSVAISTLLIVCFLVLWLLEGNYQNKFRLIHANKISYPFLLFFLIHLVGLLWSEDLTWGVHIVGKEWRILLLLFFITSVKKEHIQYYIFAFLLAMSISEICSYLIWFEIISPFKSATVTNPTPFMGHISYNPFLALSIFILLYLSILSQKYHNNFTKSISLFFIFTMSINLFITGGRAGQAGFFVMLIVALAFYFKKSITKLLISICVLLPLVFSAAYFSGSLFQERMHEALDDIQTVDENPNTSVGLRITFAKNSAELFSKNFLFGVGTGDFPKEYEKINNQNTPNANTTVNPHNMYLLVATQTGLVGLILLLSIFYMQFKISLENKNSLLPLQIALPILFLTIMFSDSYLLGHHTTLLFVYFSSFLYKTSWDSKA